MRASLTAAVRGIAAGVSALAFVTAFLLTMTTARAESPPLALLVALVAVGVGALLVAGGPSAVSVPFGREHPSTDADGEGSNWWLANLEPALEGSWTRWSDLVFGLGMADWGSVRSSSSRRLRTTTRRRGWSSRAFSASPGR
jgi:hypothetical protein